MKVKNEGWWQVFWKSPKVQEALRTLLVALLLAGLSLLGYDTQVAQPRLERLAAAAGVASEVVR